METSDATERVVEEFVRRKKPVSNLENRYLRATVNPSARNEWHPDSATGNYQMGGLNPTHVPQKRLNPGHHFLVQKDAKGSAFQLSTESVPLRAVARNRDAPLGSHAAVMQRTTAVM